MDWNLTLYSLQLLVEPLCLWQHRILQKIYIEWL